MTQSESSPPASSLEDARQRALNSGYFQLLGMHIDATEGGKALVSIDVDARLMHPQQIVHGGVIFTLADTAMSWALISLLPPGTPVSTIEAKVNYLLPVHSGLLLAEAHVVHRGRSTAVIEATVYNIDDGERKATARALGTFNFPRH